MTIIKHELKQGFKSFIIWTAIISFLLVICIFIYPEMKGQMNDLGNMFSTMGSFTEAFGMDKLDFGTLIGYYAIECGNVLGLGGAFFASLISISSLAKEENEHTAEFLLTHPITRKRVITEKLISVLIQIIAMNLIIFIMSLLSMLLINEEIPFFSIFLLHIAYLILQIEIACVLFGVSAFIARGSLGIGIGVAALLYFLNIVANISDKLEFLKYITPYGYTDGSEIITNNSLNLLMVILGIIYAICGVILAYYKYCKKNIK